MWDQVKDYWHSHGARVVVICGLVALIILAIGRRWSGKKGTSTPGLKVLEWRNLGDPVQVKQSFCSVGEQKCREFLEKKFKRPFPKTRPHFLRNGVTGTNLELDCFNPELKLAVEYNGQQHYRFTPYFHKSKEAFHNQMYRDETKRRLCKEQGIVLIEVPYTVLNVEEYLTKELDSFKLI
jgi:hypothetical protein